MRERDESVWEQREKFTYRHISGAGPSGPLKKRKDLPRIAGCKGAEVGRSRENSFLKKKSNSSCYRMMEDPFPNLPSNSQMRNACFLPMLNSF